MRNGEISDVQISASSQYGDSYSAKQGRLNFQGQAMKSGSWSARNNDTKQWFQIDLDNQNTTVSCVATQGRDDYDQWVTKYKLEYSNDGVNFQYYTEEGSSTYKVI